MIPLRQTFLEVTQSKIHTLDSLRQRLYFWRFKGEKIVFTNGVFDLLHRGHVDYLSKAADCGSILIVGVNADDSVRKLAKGPSRPLQDETSRALLLASLHCVTAVIVFPEETPYELIKLVEPDVLVKGSDYQVENIAGHDIVQAKGGTVRLIDFLEGYSTSAIEKKILGK
jgi:rfaE bifunctional protein nucleotidyltransferase chain/domain